MKNIFSPRFFFVTSAIVLAVASRMIIWSMSKTYPDLANFTMIGAMALFAGACMPKRWMGIVLPLAALFITDIFIGFHNTMWAVYGAFALMGLIGNMIRNKQNVFTIAGASILSAFLFFLITNSAMWVVGFYVPASERFYTTDMAGLADSINKGWPFFRFTLMSQLLFGAVFFGAYHFARIRKPALVRA